MQSESMTSNVGAILVTKSRARSADQVLSLLRRAPRANSSKSAGLDPCNVAGSAAQRFWRKLYGWSQVYLGQVLKERHCATLRDPCLTIDHEIFLEAHRIPAGAEEGKRHPRVPPHILDLLPHARVSTNKLVPLDADPHDGDLGASISIERGEVGERSSSDQRANSFRNDHVLLPPIRMARDDTGPVPVFGKTSGPECRCQLQHHMMMEPTQPVGSIATD